MTKSCPDTSYDIVDSVMKASDCFEEPMDGYLFCLFKDKLNNNTNIHLDLRQIGCYCIRPTVSYNNSQYCRRSR